MVQKMSDGRFGSQERMVGKFEVSEKPVGRLEFPGRIIVRLETGTMFLLFPQLRFHLINRSFEERKTCWRKGL